MIEVQSDRRPESGGFAPPTDGVDEREGASVGPSSSPISVMLVDDHPLFRDAIRRVLDRRPDFRVVAETGEGDEAVRFAASLKPDVVVLDIGLPGRSGVSVVHEIKRESPATAILVLTVHDDAEHVRSTLQGGASGFLTKDVLGGEVVEAIRRVASGDMYLCQVALRHIVAAAVSDASTAGSCGGPKLTPREIEVLALLAQGIGNREIASHLNLSTRTVKGHLEEIFSKLEVDSRTGAVTAALRLGILGVQNL